MLQIDTDMDAEKDEDEEWSEETEKNALERIRTEIENNLDDNANIYLISSKPRY